MKVRKRNGQLEEFNLNKITQAVLKAYNSVGYKINQSVIAEINTLMKDSKFENIEEISVETIQNEVENLLMDIAPYKVAKSYILHRASHKESRAIRERIDYMDKYINSEDNAASDSETDANSNVNQKNVANLEGEVYKTTNRVIQRQRMKDKLTELFPEVAKTYEEDLNNHIIYCHDESSSPTIKSYCMAASLYPLLLNGTGPIDGITPSAPNDLQSFSGQITNLVFLLSSQVKGAVALGEYIIALNYYVVKEFGSNWYNKLEEYITSKRTVESIIKKSMKQFIYGINQPAGNRGYNSPFSNISYYDKVYFKHIFEDFYYPDGTKPEWKAIDTLQRMFMRLHRELRLIKPLTFPVTTMALIHKNGKFLDEEYRKLTAEEWAKGGSFFCYLSENPTSIASCCFSKDTKFMWKSSTSGVNITTFEEFMKLLYSDQKENFKIFHNGSWVSGKVVSLPNCKMYKVITHNNKEFILTDNHINVTYDGEKTTSELTTNDYLMFNTQVLQAIPELNEHLTYEQGFVVGSFLGDGSFGASIKDTIYQIEISQNEAKYKKTIDLFNTANTQLGGHNNCTLKSVINNKYPVSLTSKEMVQFIIKWTNWSRGTTASSKELNMDCLLQSIEFRKGILDGWYHTDGGNSNRCYTTSKKLVECMEALITSLGMNSIIDVFDRTDQPVIIRNEKFKRNHPLYCVRWYEPANHRVCKNNPTSWKYKNNSIYFKIKSIEEVEYTDSVYCVECNKDEPYFTLPSGLITHNCRVLNEFTENTFSSTNGNLSIMSGSCNVITLNLNRILQNYFCTYTREEVVKGEFWKEKECREDFIKYFTEILNRVYKYHIAYKTMLYDLEDKRMFSSSNAGYIKVSKLYSTIGLIGYTEAAQFLGLDISPNEDYINFLRLIFSTVKEQNKFYSIRDKKRPFLFNSEAVPGESLGVKLYNWDKESNYWIPENQNLYNCYFYNPWNNTSILDKLKLHGKNIAPFLDGGQAAHLNLDNHLSYEQYDKLLGIAAKEGTSYFTFNIPMSECKECHHTVNAPITECPKCKSKSIRYWTRIIGYLTPIDNWSSERKLEQKKRIYNNTAGKCIDND